MENENDHRQSTGLLRPIPELLRVAEYSEPERNYRSTPDDYLSQVPRMFRILPEAGHNNTAAQIADISQLPQAAFINRERNARTEPNVGQSRSEGRNNQENIPPNPVPNVLDDPYGFADYISRLIKR